MIDFSKNDALVITYYRDEHIINSIFAGQVKSYKSAFELVKYYEKRYLIGPYNKVRLYSSTWVDNGENTLIPENGSFKIID